MPAAGSESARDVAGTPIPAERSTEVVADTASLRFREPSIAATCATTPAGRAGMPPDPEGGGCGAGGLGWPGAGAGGVVCPGAARAGAAGPAAGGTTRGTTGVAGGLATAGKGRRNVLRIARQLLRSERSRTWRRASTQAKTR